MIVILGPDQSGKTTLARGLKSLRYIHYAKDSTYEDYLKPLCDLSLLEAVLDRFIICEYPYSIIKDRKFAFTRKQWHNIILLALAQNPLFVLCTYKPKEDEYSKQQYLSYDKWDECLELYKRFLDDNHIAYLEYDHTGLMGTDVFEKLEMRWRGDIPWWIPMWQEGIGAIGSRHPKVLLVAERLGPNNMNNLPFETGPTGRMLSDMLDATQTPLGDFAVTNMVKAPRRDTRQPNTRDFELLEEELVHMKPQKVVFMGSVARAGIKVAKNLGIEHYEIDHFGYYYHRGIRDMSGYHAEWQKILGTTSKLSLR